jgi:FkbM family methyltransferase
MVSSFARWLIRMQCYNLSDYFLTTASKIIGKGFKITYNKNGYWQHTSKGTVINESYPNIRMDLDHINKEVEISFYGYRPGPNDACIDIGAGIGTECLTTSRLIGPAGRVFAVEASPITFNVLKANVLENSLPNVTCYNLAIGAQNGKIKISSNADNHLVNHIWSQEGVDVDMVTMDDFVRLTGSERIDFLRVNIEGAEKLLISKFESISRIRHVAIACHDFLTRRTGDPQFTSKEKVAAFLVANNFQIQSRDTGIDYIDDWIYGTNRNL